MTRYELWDDLIEATTSGALDWSNIPIEQEQKAYTLGLAYAAKNDPAKLAEQIELLKKMTVAAGERKAALAELEGYQLLARGEIGPAFEQFAKATSMRPEALARAHLAARNYGFAESTARQAVAKNPNQVPPLAAQVEILHAAGKDKEARDAYRLLEPARPLGRPRPAGLPPPRADRRPLEGRGNLDGPASPPANASGTDETAIDRIDLTTLGPLLWTPFPAEPVLESRHHRRPWTLAGHKGKNVLVIFFLGGKCAHCMQQLQLFCKEYEALKKQNIETVAIGTDDLEATKALKANKDGIKFAMPMLADPKLELFKLYRAYDDFESQPLHGTFLIDAQGNVRFQRISADPFLDVEFIKTEAERVNRILQAAMTERDQERRTSRCLCSTIFIPPGARRHWESFHVNWAGAIADALNESLLPEGYFAEEHAQLGTRVEIDVATFSDSEPSGPRAGRDSDGAASRLGSPCPGTGSSSRVSRRLRSLGI